MGCAFSGRTGNADDGEENSSGSGPDRSAAGAKKRARRKQKSGEPATKCAAAKLSDANTNQGKASISGFGKAIDVLDTLGSSMSSWNPGSGFLQGTAIRGNKVTVLSFEVANTIAKATMLWRSLSVEKIELLKDDIVKSEGVRILVSSDLNELLSFAAADKRYELSTLSREVIRFGDLCKDPQYHNLGRYFEKSDSIFPPEEQPNEEIEKTMQDLIDLAQHTAELYHEQHALERFEQDFRRKFHEEFNPATKHESIMIVQSELKRQRKLVASLKKKSLWFKNLGEVVEKLVDVVFFLNVQIRRTLGYSGMELAESANGQNTMLGDAGLALHYANIFSQVENIVSRPLSHPPNARDNLYQGLPPSVKSALRLRLQSNNKEEFELAHIKSEIQKTLQWISPMVENTIRAHQGFGWVGEWANFGIELNKRQPEQSSITRIQTLHYASKEKTEAYMLDLVVWLHHLVVHVKNHGYSSKSGSQATRRSIKVAPATDSQAGAASPENSTGSNASPLVSDGERDLLAKVSSRRFVYRRSKSWTPAERRNANHGVARSRRSRKSSRSCGNSPSRATQLTLSLNLHKMRSLDLIDGLDLAVSHSATLY